MIRIVAQNSTFQGFQDRVVQNQNTSFPNLTISFSRLGAQTSKQINLSFPLLSLSLLSLTDTHGFLPLLVLKVQQWGSQHQAPPQLHHHLLLSSPLERQNRNNPSKFSKSFITFINSSPQYHRPASLLPYMVAAHWTSTAGPLPTTASPAQYTDTVKVR